MSAPAVTVRRLFEVECQECGVIDSQKRRPDADRVAEQHRTLHREGAR